MQYVKMYAPPGLKIYLGVLVNPENESFKINS